MNPTSKMKTPTAATVGALEKSLTTATIVSPKACDCKRLATARARAALLAYELRKVGETFMLVRLSHHSRHCDDLEAVEAVLSSMEGA